jgi:hypothetical protein
VQIPNETLRICQRIFKPNASLSCPDKLKPKTRQIPVVNLKTFRGIVDIIDSIKLHRFLSLLYCQEVKKCHSKIVETEGFSNKIPSYSKNLNFKIIGCQEY